MGKTGKTNDGDSELASLRKENSSLKEENTNYKVIIAILEGELRAALGASVQQDHVKHETAVKRETTVKRETVPDGTKRTKREGMHTLDMENTTPSKAKIKREPEQEIEIVYDSEPEGDEHSDFDPNDQPFFRMEDDTSHNLQNGPERRVPSPDGEAYRSAGPSTSGVTVTAQSVVVKREPSPDSIEVQIKQEGQEDEEKYVYFTKSEDGKLDIWDLSGFDLGPETPVDEQRRNVGFTRKNISDALGGNWQTCAHNWYSDAKLAADARKHNRAKKEQYLCFNREWNSQLPMSEGSHGVVFASLRRFDDGVKVNKPIEFFVGEGPNNWQQRGTYSVMRWGEINPVHMHTLPSGLISTWVHGALATKWGEGWVAETNERIVEAASISGEEIRLIEYTEDGIRAALLDGRLIIGFTIMKCVGFNTAIFDQCLHYKDHPKPPKPKSAPKPPKDSKSTQSGKRKAPSKDANSKGGRKAAKGKGGERITRSDSDEEEEEEEEEADLDDTGSDIEEDVGKRSKMAPKPRRPRRITLSP